MSDKRQRNAIVERITKETSVKMNLNLDGQRQIKVETGLGFLDHMLTSLAFHAGFDLQLRCSGDLQVDDHHTVEDCALALGEALSKSLGDRIGICRFGYAYAPLDESLARAVVDLSGRPTAVIDLGLKREKIGDVACENLTHFFVSLAMNAKMSLHVDVLRGENDHHRVEAAFKALAIALREATRETEAKEIPSVKGTLK